MLDGAVQAVSAAKLQPAMVDLNSFAVLRAQAYASSGLMSPSAEALVDIGASVTNIVVHHAGVPRFVRILSMGGGGVTSALAERLGVPWAQAELLKRRGSPAAVESASASTPSGLAVVEAAGRALVEEVRGSLDYYDAQRGSVPVGRVVLSGGGSRLGGLAERLSAATGLSVEPARPLSTVTVGRIGLTDEQLAEAEMSVAVPVGLALAMAS